MVFRIVPEIGEKQNLRKRTYVELGIQAGRKCSTTNCALR